MSGRDWTQALSALKHVGPLVPLARERSVCVEFISLRARSFCEALGVGVRSPVDVSFVLRKASYRHNRKLGLTVASALGIVLEEESAVDGAGIDVAGLGTG